MLHVFTAVCPSCGSLVTLKGTKLRQWLKNSRQQKSTSGPYCNYQCSTRANIQKAILKRSQNFKSNSPSYGLLA